MPKVDTDCEVSSSLTTAPAPLPAGQTSAAPALFGSAGSTTPAATGGFGSTGVSDLNTMAKVTNKDDTIIINIAEEPTIENIVKRGRGRPRKDASSTSR